MYLFLTHKIFTVIPTVSLEHKTISTSDDIPLIKIATVLGHEVYKSANMCDDGYIKSKQYIRPFYD